MANYYVETSEGTIGIHLDEKKQLIPSCKEWVERMMRHAFKCRQEDPVEVRDTLEGLFLTVHLEDESFGTPEYKIRERFTAQMLDIEHELDPTRESRYSWMWTYCNVM